MDAIAAVLRGQSFSDSEWRALGALLAKARATRGDLMEATATPGVADRRNVQFADILVARLRPKLQALGCKVLASAGEFWIEMSSRARLREMVAGAVIPGGAAAEPSPDASCSAPAQPPAQPQPPHGEEPAQAGVSNHGPWGFSEREKTLAAQIDNLRRDRAELQARFNSSQNVRQVLEERGKTLLADVARLRDQLADLAARREDDAEEFASTLEAAKARETALRQDLETERANHRPPPAEPGNVVAFPHNEPSAAPSSPVLFAEIHPLSATEAKIVRAYAAAGNSAREIAQLTGHPLPLVERALGRKARA